MDGWIVNGRWWTVNDGWVDSGRVDSEWWVVDG